MINDLCVSWLVSYTRDTTGRIPFKLAKEVSLDSVHTGSANFELTGGNLALYFFFLLGIF